MPTTALGIHYPDENDEFEPDVDMQLQAESVDTLLTKLPMGKASSIAAHTGITAEAVSLTVSNMAFKAGQAYRVFLRASIYGTSGALVLLRIRKTNAAGASWGEFGRVETKGVSAGTGILANGQLILLRSAGSDLTCDVCLTVAPSTGTVNVFADASNPRVLAIEHCGTATDYADLGVEVT